MASVDSVGQDVAGVQGEGDQLFTTGAILATWQRPGGRRGQPPANEACVSRHVNKENAREVRPLSTELEPFLD